MKALPAFAGVLWVATVLMAPTLQAAPPQPLIQMPRHDLEPDASAALRPHDREACIGDGTGYVRARIRGAMNLDLNWKDAQLDCDGDVRPDGSGLRVSFAGPGPGGKVLRLVFGVRSAREGLPGRELPTHLTVLLEGGRVFATQGDDQCTLDQLTQRRLPDQAGARAWRVEARGFCVAPANALAGTGRIVVSTFDFAGWIGFSGRG